MFNTMTITKAAGALIGSLLLLLLVGWGASSLYTIAPAHHGDEPAPQAYVVPVEGGGEAKPAGEEAAPVDVAALMGAADAAAGEKEFGKCKSCHKLDGANAVGPHLNGVHGRAVASVEGFAYSDGMKAHGGNWDDAALFAFLENPKGVVPGTKMTFAGVKSPEARANLIAYLASKP